MRLPLRLRDGPPLREILRAKKMKKKKKKTKIFILRVTWTSDSFYTLA